MTAPTEEEAWGLEAQPPYLPLEALERRDALWARGTMLVYEPETAQGASLPSPGLGRLLCVPSPLTIPFSTHPAVLTTHAAARATRTVLHTVLGGAVVVDCAAGSFCLCAVTPAALYALRRPAPAYAAHCVTLARRCGLLARCAAALASPEGGRLSYVDVVSRATALPLPPSTLLPSDSRRALTELDLVACAPALVAQLRQLGEAGCVPAQALDASPFMAHLRALAQPLPGAPPQQPGSYMAAYGPDGPPPAQQAAPADGSSPKAKKAPKQPRGDKAAPPPVVPRTSPFPALPGPWDCLPREVMPDLLMLWDLLGTFAGLLRLPPVPLSRAAHAFYGPVDGNPLAPGDTTAARCVFADACRAMVHILDGDAQPPGGAAAGSSEPGGAPRVSRAMRLLGTDARAGASPALLCAAIDRAAWPARALAWHTRAVHSASHAPQAGGEPGGEGDVSSGEGDDDTDGAAHAHSVAAGARLSSRAALRALRTAAESDGDPWDALEPQQRCALAIGLADALSASEAFRAHYDALTDAATAERTAGRAPPYPVPGGSGEGPSWEEAAVHRAMLRRGQPVGWDADGRRYLELAGACGANCLVVAAPLQGGAEHQEETPQLSWHLVERELVFDVDMTDYDDVRSCCTGGAICAKCWPYMTIAVRVVDAALRDDFGFRHVMWVYSGRRGVHCWVCDPAARRLTNEQRTSVAEYLTVGKTSEKSDKKIVQFPLHPSLARAYNEVLLPMWLNTILPAQKLLETEKKVDALLAMIPDEGSRAALAERLKSGKRLGGANCTSKEEAAARWGLVQSTVEKAVRKVNKHDLALTAALEQCCQSIVFAHIFPRLDVEVSKHMNHLLKAPFCVHPKTGKICIPFDPENIDQFDPDKVPTLE